MPDGSRVASLTTGARTREPALDNALDALLACAEQGKHPAGMLADIRTLLSSRGLLLHDAPVDAADPAPPPCSRASLGRS